MNSIARESLALERFQHWESRLADSITLTQPLGAANGGRIQTFTWAQVGDEARRMAAHLKAQGWEPGSRVAILSKNCAWWLMSDLAIWMAGHVSVPLYPTLAPDTIRHILTHSGARACFIGKLDGWEGMKPGVPEDLPCISYALSPEDARQRYESWDAICARNAPLQGALHREADELATIIYTSGTTGLPKGVMHSFGAFAWGVPSALKRLPLRGPQDRLLSYLPLAHVVERGLVEHGWLHTGAQIFFADSLDSFAHDLQRARPTVFFSVPRLWVKFQQAVHAKLPPAKLQRLLKIPLVGALVRRKILKTLGLDQCHFAAGGAAPMPVKLLQWYRQLGLPINEGYGMTENLAVSHLTVPGVNQEGTVGPAYEGVQTRVDPVSQELLVRSPAVMLGYYREPELTRAALSEDGWLRTGDKVVQEPDGCLRITGRVKDLFKTSKGKYVAPAPIEDQLGMHPAIEACVVTGANLPQPLGLAMLAPAAAAQCESADGRVALAQELGAHLAEVNARLDPHEQLDCLVALKTPWTVDNGFITPTFKVRRDRIEAVFGAKLEAWSEQRQQVIFGD